MTGSARPPTPVSPAFPVERRPQERLLFSGALVAAFLAHAAVLSLVPLPPLEEPDLPERHEPPTIHHFDLPPPKLPDRPVELPRDTSRRIPVPAPDPDVPGPVVEPRPVVDLTSPPPIETAAWMVEAAAPPGPSGPVDERLPGLVRPRALEGRVRPEYPELGRRAGLSGTVLLRAVITEEGEVASIEVLRAPVPDAGFSDAAIAAVRRWRYAPGMLEGRPVAVSMTVVVEFDLE